MDTSSEKNSGYEGDELSPALQKLIAQDGKEPFHIIYINQCGNHVTVIIYATKRDEALEKFKRAYSRLTFSDKSDEIRKLRFWDNSTEPIVFTKAEYNELK